MSGIIRVGVVVYEDVDELDAVGVFTPLVKAAELGAPVEPVLVGTAPVTMGAAGLAFTGVRDLSTLEDVDALVVPGGRGALRAADDAHLCRALAATAGRRVRYYAVCSGVVVLAAAGLTRGRRVAMHADKIDMLQYADVRAVSAGLVRDGELTTIGGVPATRVKSVDIAFAVLEDLWPAVLTPLTARLEVRAA